MFQHDDCLGNSLFPMSVVKKIWGFLPFLVKKIWGFLPFFDEKDLGIPSFFDEKDLGIFLFSCYFIGSCKCSRTHWGHCQNCLTPFGSP